MEWKNFEFGLMEATFNKCLAMKGKTAFKAGNISAVEWNELFLARPMSRSVR